MRIARNKSKTGLQEAEGKQTKRSLTTDKCKEKKSYEETQGKEELWKSGYLVGQLLHSNNPTGGGKTIMELAMS